MLAMQNKTSIIRFMANLHPDFSTETLGVLVAISWNEKSSAQLRPKGHLENRLASHQRNPSRAASPARGR